MNKEKATVFLSGASDGIGRACALTLSKEGYNCILCARNFDKLKSLKEEIESTSSSKVHILTMDVRDKFSVEKNIATLPKEWQDIDILINNAGLALSKEHFVDLDVLDFETMIDTNIKGLLYVTKGVLPLILKRPKGHIINIGSIAGDIGYPGGSVYCMTKSAVKTFTDALRIELVDKPIKVTNLKPGATQTNFSVVRFKGDKEKAKQIYQGFTPLYAEDIAEVISFLLKTKDHVQISELTVLPRSQATIFHTHKES